MKKTILFILFILYASFSYAECDWRCVIPPTAPTDQSDMEITGGTAILEELSVYDTDASHSIEIKWNEDDSADRTLNVKVNSDDRTADFSGDLFIEAASRVNQDLTTDASGVTFTGGLESTPIGGTTPAAGTFTKSTVSGTNPTVALKDTDATAGDDNATFDANCTDNGDGTEDCDLTGEIQIAGVPTEWVSVDASDAAVSFPLSVLVDGPFVMAADGGLQTHTSKSVTASSADGTDEGYVLRIDGSNILKIAASSDGAGSVDELQTLTVSGTKELPGKGFLDDIDTGVYRPLDDQIAISSGANEGIRIIQYNDGVDKTVTILNATENDAVTDATTNGTTTITKVGDNFSSTLGANDYIIIYSGTTGSDYGVYEIQTVTDNENLVLDRIVSGSNSDVDFVAMDSTSIIHEQDGEHYTDNHFGEMFFYESAGTETVGQTDQYYGVQGQFSVGMVNGFSFVAGSTGSGNITTAAAGAAINIADVAHGLVSGDYVNVQSANHSGTSVVTYVDADNFTVAIAYVGDEAATWQEGDYLLAGSSTRGAYSVFFSNTSAAGAAAKVYKFEAVQNATHLDNTAFNVTTSGTDPQSGSGMQFVTVASGDRFWVQFKNETDTQDLAYEHMCLNIKEL